MPVELPVKDQPLLDTSIAPGSPNLIAPSLVDTLPLPVVLWLAAPYLAGRSLEEAVRKAQQLFEERRFTSTIDILGEDCTVESDCDQFVEAYRRAIDSVAKNQLPARTESGRMTVSFKPSMFSTVVPTDESEEGNRQLAETYYRIKTVVDYAKQRGVRITIEAEDHHWTDFQLETYFSLLNEGYDNLGTVLQSRLFRTKTDIQRFDERCRVRLVIGIYNEPAEVAHTNKPLMKELLVDYASDLAAQGTYVELASHDTQTVRKFIERVAIPQKLSAEKFETQWLLGVPRQEEQQALASGSYFKEMAQQAPSTSLDYLSELAHTGVVVRMYLPFGKDAVAGPYCKRRLRANPHMISYGIKNFLHLR
jgi:proline dehydrogenase